MVPIPTWLGPIICGNARPDRRVPQIGNQSDRVSSVTPNYGCHAEGPCRAAQRRLGNSGAFFAAPPPSANLSRNRKRPNVESIGPSGTT
jgi:hypothetical protein